MKPINELTLDEIQKFTIKNPYFKWVEITGGEPFLRNDIVEIVKAFHDNCKNLYLLTIPTNSLTNHEMLVKKLDQILSLGIPKVSITISLDGNRELHDKIRGVPGNYDKCINLWKNLAELKKKHKNLFFVFGYTISKFNEGKFEDVFNDVKKDLPDITYNNFHLNIGQLSDAYYNNLQLSISADKKIVVNDVRFLLNNRKRRFNAIDMIEHAYLKKLVEYAETGKSPMKTKSLDASLFMDSYGNVFPSIMWNIKVGNIRDTNYDLSPIWNNQEAEKIRKLIKEGKEPDCWTACEAYQTLAGNILSLL
jgi:MoaA/NifB/PqqE/SkfB family radical SAM enzyme